MLRVAVCDDETQMHKELQQFFSKLTANTLYKFDVHYFSSGEELLLYYQDQGRNAFHILVLDVEMNGINGIDTAKKVRSLPDRDVQIIFLTSYPEYMMNSFDVQTFQYLLKPLSYLLFETKMVKLCNYIFSSVNKFLTIRTEKEQIVLRISDIVSIVKVKHSLIQNKLKVTTVQQQYIISGTLLEYLNRLDNSFLLIHRSVIINLQHVRKFTAISVAMSNLEELPIGRTQAKAIKNAYARYMTGRFQE
ncbi:two component transcriptional regulator, LytTR family [Paenibacillus sophorae]|uniref:LytTR family DNA-binding domain-containing protein n=1 Tax=Paenibacillus sophorae TaxID=1333845 RepID=A0A1H8PP53_9BACL|nr:LytTR family DNA-binding domain-containing protein [Paenibacillus sophorae]QWU16639.1 LytTR family DNA-binding domain-containing protein [Paenibacillus sophorae]SEO43497.1 two component transcriptional regulator, LytTR family [Paenibacillus sophorae]